MKEKYFIVTYYNDEGKDFDADFSNLEDAIKKLEDCYSFYYTENGDSFNSLMSEPYLSHPDGSGRLWDLEKSCWT